MRIKENLKTILNRNGIFAQTVLKPLYICFMRSKLVNMIRFRPHMNDEKYISWVYRKRFGIYPNLSNPKNFNEKNNWRKLHDRKPRYTDMVDKYRLKEVVRDACGEGYTIPLLGVWDDARKIDFGMLPNQFVLKVNHAGGVIVCRDKKMFNIPKAVEELNRALQIDYFSQSREWPYKNVVRQIICEEYMGENLVDYKNYCFNGKPMYTLIWKNVSRADGRKPDPFFCGMYDRAWIKTDMELGYPSKMDEICEKPSCYDEMMAVCAKMSADIPFVRVDCFIIDGHVYVGEMTFFPWGGFQKFKDENWNLKLGEMERLQEIDI